jgi:hypothetical protein
LVHVLTCVECGREQAADDRGLKAYLTNDEEEPAEALTEALTYCPERAEEEFGPQEPPTRPVRAMPYWAR